MSAVAVGTPTKKSVPHIGRQPQHSVLFDAPGPKARRRILIGNIIGVIVVAAVIGVVLWKLWDQGQLDASRWAVVFTGDAWLNFLLPGLLSTLLAAAVSIVGAFIFGLLFGVGRLAMNKPIRWISTVIVEFFRAVPVLLMMIFVWLLFVQMKVNNPEFLGVVIALILYNGSVCADLVRSGVQNLPKGQHEASAAIGLRRHQAMINVLLPQALLAMAPALIAQLVVALKDSALGSAITYSELLREAILLGGMNAALPALFMAAVIFIAINYSLGKLGEALARRMRSRTGGLEDEAVEDIPMNVGAVSTKWMLGSVDIEDDFNQENRRHEPPYWPQSDRT